ncbi:hypothetical protein OSTOST_07682 [Ostertagia ostertagi]
MSSGDHVAMTMLAMAETLRQLQPPKVKMAIKCTKVRALTLTLSPEMTAHVRFQLGKLYFFYTENLDLALQFLESRNYMMTTNGPPNAASSNRMLTLIRSELANAKAFPTIYAKLFFYYIEVNTIDGRADDALEACQVAIQQFVDDPIVNLYFRLTRNMVSARVAGTVCDDSETMIIGQLINRLDQSSPATANLKLFYICTLLAFMLSDGKLDGHGAVDRFRLLDDHCQLGSAAAIMSEQRSTIQLLYDISRITMQGLQYSQRQGGVLFEEFGPAIQSLLGHYCSYLREPDAAEKHFLAATKFKSCKDKNIWVMTHVNLAITYLAQCKHAEFYEIADQTLIAECMETAKTEDLFRLHGLSVLLFSIFVPVNAEVILPTLDWSKKGHDHSLHCWSNNTMARVLASHGMDGSAYIEAARKEMALLDEGVIRAEHLTNPSAALVEWFEGDPTAFLPKDE